MIRKGLTKTLIVEYLHTHKLTEIQQILNQLPDLYKFLKQHPLQPVDSGLTFEIFQAEASIGVQTAQLHRMRGRWNDPRN